MKRMLTKSTDINKNIKSNKFILTKLLDTNRNNKSDKENEVILTKLIHVNKNKVLKRRILTKNNNTNKNIERIRKTGKDILLTKSIDINKNIERVGKTEKNISLTKNIDTNKTIWKQIRPVWWPTGPPEKGCYQEYVFSKKELGRYCGLGILGVCAISKVFYDSVFAFFLCLPIVYFYLDEKAKDLQKKRKEALTNAFRDTILSVSNNLQAGFSIENSFIEAQKDIEMLYGTTSDMYFELYYMQRQLQTNQTLEIILKDMANRTQIEDMKEFAEIFQIAKRMGGDLRVIIANTAKVIQDKREVKQELETSLTEKKMEKSIMQSMPFLIVLYISITSTGFFTKLYHNVIGIGIMTGCLGIYVAACYMMKKILEMDQ